MLGTGCPNSAVVAGSVSSAGLFAKHRRRVGLLAVIPGSPALCRQARNNHRDQRCLDTAHPVSRSVRAEADVAEHARIEEIHLDVFPVLLVNRAVPLQAMAEPLRLPTELVVRQGVGGKRARRAVQRDIVDAGLVARGRAVESARTEALRPGVVSEHIREDVPRQIRPALEALVRGAQILVVDTRRGREARRGTGLITTEAARDRADLGVVEMVVARAGRNGQHLGNDVEVDRGEGRRLA